MRLHVATTLLFTAALSACLGTVEVGGTVSGLPAGASVTLQNNGDEQLVVKANGSFTFGEPIGDGEAYSVVVVTQPVGATCTVEGGSGTAATDATNITSVAVRCTATATVMGTVSGLATGAAVVLSNGTTTQTVATNGAWAFSGMLAAGAPYAVTVQSQPANGQVCTVANGSGSAAANVVTAITVTCV